MNPDLIEAIRKLLASPALANPNPEWHGHAACEAVAAIESALTPKPPAYKCRECGNTEGLQVAMWVDPNTNEVHDDFGSWTATDNKWCPECDAHVRLVPVPHGPAS